MNAGCLRCGREIAQESTAEYCPACEAIYARLEAMQKPAARRESNLTEAERRQAARTTTQREHDNFQLARVLYALFVATPLLGGTFVPAVIMAHLSRDEREQHWIYSHFSWLVSTFWITMGLQLIGVIAGLFLHDLDLRRYFKAAETGYQHLLLALPGVLWYLYRLIKGWYRLSRQQPV